MYNFLQIGNNVKYDFSAPPFQIIRRGWGEFPIRVQLFFKDDLEQKPIQIIHNLVLDKARTGLQLMGNTNTN